MSSVSWRAPSVRSLVTSVKPGACLHALDQTLRVVVELGLAHAGQRVLIERGAAAAADAQVLQRHGERADAGNARQVAAQAVLHVADGAPVQPLGARLQLHEDRAAIERGIEGRLLHVGIDVEHVGIGANALGDDALPVEHGLEGDVGRRLRAHDDDAGVLGRQKALLDHREGPHVATMVPSVTISMSHGTRSDASSVTR